MVPRSELESAPTTFPPPATAEKEQRRATTGFGGERRHARRVSVVPPADAKDSGADATSTAPPAAQAAGYRLVYSCELRTRHGER